MNNKISDKLLLNNIYNTYYNEYKSYKKAKKDLRSKAYVPIDCNLISKQLNMDPDILFGRLYYHLNNKYMFHQDDGSEIHLFIPKLGDNLNAINFPMLSATLANLEEDHHKTAHNYLVSTLAVLIAFAALLANYI